MWVTGSELPLGVVGVNGSTDDGSEDSIRFRLCSPGHDGPSLDMTPTSTYLEFLQALVALHDPCVIIGLKSGPAVTFGVITGFLAVIFFEEFVRGDGGRGIFGRFSSGSFQAVDAFVAHRSAILTSTFSVFGGLERLLGAIFPLLGTDGEDLAPVGGALLPVLEVAEPGGFLLEVPGGFGHVLGNMRVHNLGLVAAAAGAGATRLCGVGLPGMGSRGGRSGDGGTGYEIRGAGFRFRGTGDGGQITYK